MLIWLERLKIKCEYIIQDSVDVENVCSLLVGARQYRAEQLRKFCLKYITSHKHSIKETKGFSELSKNSEVLLDLLFEFMTD